MPDNQFVKHISCKCGSSDGRAVYSDGGEHCFVCADHLSPYNKPEELQEQEEIVSTSLVQGRCVAIPARGITKETCQKYNYWYGEYNGRPVHIANHYYRGKIVVQKLRFDPKDFLKVGDKSKLGLWGKHTAGSGKRIAITEGEIDALSLSQALNNRWPVVSIPNGAQDAAKSIKKDLQYLSGFEHIVIMFDMDEEGQKAAIECARVLPVGKVSIASLPMHDANEMLQEGKVEDLANCYWRAEPYRPAGIIDHDELYDKIQELSFKSDVSYPWPLLNAQTYGIRKREIVLVLAGTGMGKSCVVRHIGLELLKQQKKTMWIVCEEDDAYTAMSVVGLEAGRIIQIQDEYRHTEEFKQQYDRLIRERAFIFDYSKVSSVEALLDAIRYHVIANGCEYVILDHINLVCIGKSPSETFSLIEDTCAKLRRLVDELGIGLFLVSQLKRLDGKRGHEEGEEVYVSHAKGAGGLAAISNAIIALQAKENDPLRRQLVLRKSRFSGWAVGYADELLFNTQTGRIEVDNHY